MILMLRLYSSRNLHERNGIFDSMAEMLKGVTSKATSAEFCSNPKGRLYESSRRRLTQF